MHVDLYTFFMIIGAIVVGIAVVAIAVLYVFSRVRKQDLKLLREDNADLRASRDDQSLKIKTLMTNVSILQGEIVGMRKQIGELEQKNGNLESLVKDSLVVYFREHPEMATVTLQSLSKT